MDLSLWLQLTPVTGLLDKRQNTTFFLIYLVRTLLQKLSVPIIVILTPLSESSLFSPFFSAGHISSEYSYICEYLQFFFSFFFSLEHFFPWTPQVRWILGIISQDTLSVFYLHGRMDHGRNSGFMKTMVKSKAIGRDNKCVQVSIPWAGFKPSIPQFTQPKNTNVTTSQTQGSTGILLLVRIWFVLHKLVKFNSYFFLF